MADAPSALNRRLKKVRERGLLRFGWDAARRRVYSRTISIYFERDLSPLTRRYRVPKDISVRTAFDLTQDNCRKYFASHWPTYRRLLDEGCVPVAAFRGADVIAITWTSERAYQDDDVYKFFFPVAEDQVYQFAGEMTESYRRGSAIPAAILDFSWEFFRQRGKTRVYAITNVENTPSIRLHVGVGFHEVGRKLVTRSILGWTRSTEEPYQGSLADSPTPRARNGARRG